MRDRVKNNVKNRVKNNVKNRVKNNVKNRVRLRDVYSGLSGSQLVRDIVYVELPKVGSAYKGHDVFGTVEAVKAVSELYMPVSGEVAAINERAHIG